MTPERLPYEDLPPEGAIVPVPSETLAESIKDDPPGSRRIQVFGLYAELQKAEGDVIYHAYLAQQPKRSFFPWRRRRLLELRRREVLSEAHVEAIALRVALRREVLKQELGPDADEFTKAFTEAGRTYDVYFAEKFFSRIRNERGENGLEGFRYLVTNAATADFLRDLRIINLEKSRSAREIQGK